MRKVYLTNKEFKELSSVFLEKVLVRKDVFQKTNPAELRKFEKFLQNNNSFDCIIDGLNVAFSTGIKKSNASYAKLVHINIIVFFF